MNDFLQAVEPQTLEVRKLASFVFVVMCLHATSCEQVGAPLLLNGFTPCLWNPFVFIELLLACGMTLKRRRGILEGYICKFWVFRVVLDATWCCLGYVKLSLCDKFACSWFSSYHVYIARMYVTA